MKTSRKLVLLALLPLAARAQSDLGQNYVQLSQSLMSVSMINNVLANNVAAHDGKAVASTPTTYDYQPTAALEQQTVERLVSQVKTSSPSAASTIAGIFAPGKVNYEQAYASINAGTGLRENNLADVMAAYIITGYMVANDVENPNAISQNAAKWTSINLVPALAKMPQLKNRATAAQVGEEFKLQTVLLQLGWEETKKNHTLAAYRQQTANNFRQKFGLDLAQLKITERGLAKK